MYNYRYNELDGSIIRYYYGNGGIVGFRYNGNRYYYEKNLMGDIIGIYDTNGNKVAGYIYDAWGNCTVQTYGTDARIAEVNPFRYRGYYYDSDIELYYLKSRYYDAVTGRFINADSVNYLGAEAILWVVGCDITGGFGRGAKWGLYTQYESDAKAMAGVLSTTALPAFDAASSGQYAHYHPNDRSLFDSYKHFHVWFGNMG